MSTITDLVSSFVSNFVPEIVGTVVELHKKEKTEAEIVAEICGKDFTAVSAINSGSHKTPGGGAKRGPKPTVKKTICSVQEYKDNHFKEAVCVHVFPKGQNKDMVCCSALEEGKFEVNDIKTYKCPKHASASSSKDIMEMISKLDSPDSSATRVEKVSTLVKGAPKAVVSDDSSKQNIEDGLTGSTPKPSNTAKSILSKFKEKIESKTPEKEATDEDAASASASASKSSSHHSEDTASASASSSVSRTPSPEKEAEPPAPAPVKKVPFKMPVKKAVAKKEMTLEEFEESIPKDPNADEDDNPYLFIKQTLPSADEYSWMMISKKSMFVLSPDGANCYGYYEADDDIDSSENYTISEAWKSLVNPLQSVHIEFLEKLGIEAAKLDD